jgi:hypothetical protein
MESELVERPGEPAVRRLRKTLLDVLDRPAYTRRGGAPA